MDRPQQNSSSPRASVIVQESTAVSTIQCKNCMAILPEEAKFCGQCGRAVKCDRSPLVSDDTIVVMERQARRPLPAESELATEVLPLVTVEAASGSGTAQPARNLAEQAVREHEEHPARTLDQGSTDPQTQRHSRQHAKHKQQASQRPLWQLLLKIIGSWFGRRVPPIIQLTEVECGAACLAMILTYYGRKTSVSEIRERCGVGRDGLSALSLVKAARSYGLRVRAVSLQHNDFRFVKLPAIVHWEFNHFLVVERWSPKFVVVVDPASGRRRIPAVEFDAGFTGVVLMLEPGPQFDRQAVASPLTLRTYAVNYLKQAPLMFVQILVATVLLEVLGLAVPVLTAVVVDQVLPFHMTNILWLLAAGLFILVLSQLVIMLLRALLLIYLRTRLDTHVMLNSFEHLLSLPMLFFLRRSSGDILSRLESNIIIFDLLSDQLISTILDGSFVIVYLVILFSQSPAFGLLVSAIGLLQVVLLLCSTGPMRALASRELEAQGMVQGYETEALVGIETLKAAGAEQRVFERWSNLFFNQLNSSLRRNYLSSVIQTLLSSLSALSPLLLLWFGAIQVLNHTMQVGTMLALNALAAAFLAPLASLVH